MQKVEISVEPGGSDLGPGSVESGAENEKRGEASRVGRLLWRALWDLVSTVVPAVLIALFVNIFVVQAMVVQGPSMQPNLQYNQRVMVEKLSYRLIHGPRRGDVVVVEIADEKEPLIKRVVAIPGETVEVRDGQVFINGDLLDEPWVTRQGGPYCAGTRVPPLHVFLLGDNRGSSRDSRVFGPVSVDQIVGRAWLIYWPLDQIKSLY